MKKAPQKPPGDHKPVLRAYFTTRNGKRIYAADYGYKAWPIGKSANRPTK